MKKFDFSRWNMVSFTFVFITLLSFLLVMCKKTPEEISPPSNTLQKYPVVQGVQSFNEEFDLFDPSEADAGTLLTEFNDEVEAEDVESREVSEAIWVLEAYLSYFHNNLDYQFDSYDYYEEEFEFALDTTYEGDTMVLGEDILDAFNQINSYVNDELDPDEVYLIDIFYGTYSGGIISMKAGIFAGPKGELRESAESISYLPSGTYEPHYTGSCTSLPLAITNSLNINYHRVNCGPNIRYLSNVQKIPIAHLNTSCCSGSTLGAEKHLYEKHQFNYCLNAGSSTDDGYSGTANGWLNEAQWLVDWEEAKLSNNDKIILFKLDSERNWHPTPPYGGHYDYEHFAEMESGKVYCIDGFN